MVLEWGGEWVINPLLLRPRVVSSAVRPPEGQGAQARMELVMVRRGGPQSVPGEQEQHLRTKRRQDKLNSEKGEDSQGDGVGGR